MANPVAVKPVWDTCDNNGCIGIRLPEAHQCLAHCTGPEQEAALKLISRTGVIDARGVPITRTLLERVLKSAPRDNHGDPLFKDASFQRVTFSGDAVFSKVKFDKASFSNATFEGAAAFDRATFLGYATFADATFVGAANFSQVGFEGLAWFDRVIFNGAALFLHAAFPKECRPRQSTGPSASRSSIGLRGHVSGRCDNKGAVRPRLHLTRL